MNFDNDEDIMKAINAKGEGDMDLDDELAAMEAELEGGQKKGKKKKKDGDDLSLSDLSDEEEQKPAKKERKKSDDDLAALEKEGLDDLEDEDEKPVEKKPQPKPQAQPQPKQQPKPQPKPQPKVQQMPQSKPQFNKEELAKAMQKKQPQKSGGDDLYPAKVENKYNDVNKMTSLTVKKKKKELCDKIISYKKSKNEDYDTWDLKKPSIDDKINLITSYVQDGMWDLPLFLE